MSAYSLSLSITRMKADFRLEEERRDASGAQFVFHKL